MSSNARSLIAYDNSNNEDAIATVDLAKCFKGLQKSDPALTLTDFVDRRICGGDGVVLGERKRNPSWTCDIVTGRQTISHFRADPKTTRALTEDCVGVFAFCLTSRDPAQTSFTGADLSLAVFRAIDTASATLGTSWATGSIRFKHTEPDHSGAWSYTTAKGAIDAIAEEAQLSLEGEEERL